MKRNAALRLCSGPRACRPADGLFAKPSRLPRYHLCSKTPLTPKAAIPGFKLDFSKDMFSIRKVTFIIHKPDKLETRSTKYEMRNKSEILIFKCSKQWRSFKYILNLAEVNTYLLIFSFLYIFFFLFTLLFFCFTFEKTLYFAEVNT